MLQTVKYPQRSKLPTFHTLSKVLKLHMSFNTVPILWLEGCAGMVRASWYKDDGEYLRTFGYQKKTRHCSKYAATFACWIESVRTGPIFTTKSKKIKPPSSFKLSGSALKNSTHCLVRVARVELTASWTPLCFSQKRNGHSDTTCTQYHQISKLFYHSVSLDVKMFRFFCGQIVVNRPWQMTILPY